MGLFVRLDPLSSEVHAPALLAARGVISDLRHRDADLRRPAAFVPLDVRLPNGVPGVVAPRVVVEVVVALDVGCAHTEEIAGAPVEIRIQRDLEIVVLPLLVTANQLAGDRLGLAVVHAGPDVQRAAVE